MGHQHDHCEGGGGHAHDHTAGANARSLSIALALTGSFLIAELAGAWLFNSLALLSDAAHMFTDAAALAIALAAIRIGQRPADKKRTYGYRRFEILAASFNALLLFVIAGYVLYEGIQRLLDPQPVGSVGMLAVAFFGLVVNLIAMRVLAGGRDRSLNVKGAYLEVWADMLGSIGVLLAAALIWLTGWTWVDPAGPVGPCGAGGEMTPFTSPPTTCPLPATCAIAGPPKARAARPAAIAQLPSRRRLP